MVNKRINILGIDISAINMSDALSKIEHLIITKKQGYVCVCPNHTIMESQKDSKLRDIVNSADVATPDGMSIVWASRLLGHHEVEQVAGSELMIAISDLSAKKGYTHFYYGGDNSVPGKLAESIQQRFPNLKIVGTYSPPFRKLADDENNAIIDMINNTNPDIVWVGLGMPKQELWIGDHFGQIKAPVMIGVGAAFDFLSGKKKRAPKWVQKAGLEWLFRLIQEPKRLWRRNLYHPIFFFKLFLQILGIKKSSNIN
jgi:N-acetylglucosaminyldiphosphoundecaprenol N-acetyl-beta-D-mannosaminyltransferase